MSLTFQTMCEPPKEKKYSVDAIEVEKKFGRDAMECLRRTEPRIRVSYDFELDQFSFRVLSPNTSGRDEDHWYNEYLKIQDQLKIVSVSLEKTRTQFNAMRQDRDRMADDVSRFEISHGQLNSLKNLLKEILDG